MVTPQDPFYRDLSGNYRRDPERAKALLAEAGHGDGLAVTFDIPNLPYAVTAAEVIQSQLREIGVSVTIHTLEFPAVWLDQVFTRHEFQMSIIMHSEARDLVTVLQPTYYLGYDNPDLLAQMAAADAAPHDQWITGMESAVDQLLIDLPGLVLYLAPVLVVANADLAGIQANAVTESMDLTALYWRGAR
jgi:peptide/nickel transport system substrate-binding protein